MVNHRLRNPPVFGNGCASTRRENSRQPACCHLFILDLAAEYMIARSQSDQNSSPVQFTVGRNRSDGAPAEAALYLRILRGHSLILCAAISMFFAVADVY